MTGAHFTNHLAAKHAISWHHSRYRTGWWARRVILRDHAKRRALTRAAGEAQNHQPLTPIDLLLAVDDANRVGALRFQDEEGVSQRATGEGRRAAPPLIELSTLMTASRAVETNTEAAEDLAYLRGRGTSLGGLRPKCSVIDDDGALSIGKFPSVEDERPVTKGEVLAMQLLRQQGSMLPRHGSSTATVSPSLSFVD